MDAYPLQIGGAHRATANLIDALVGSEWSGRVIVPSIGPASEWLADHGVRVEVVPAPATLMSYGGRLRGVAAGRAVLALPGYWWRLRRALRDADLVWINDLRALWLAGPAARLAGKPVVWQVHARQPQYRWSARIAKLLSRRTVVPSAAAGRDLLPPGASFEVLPNVVAELAAAQPVDGPVPALVTVARLHPAKGIDVLLRACGMLADRGIEHRLTVVGGSQPGYETYPDELDRLCGSLGLSTVTFAGELAEPLQVVSGATVYVQPSHHETFGLAVLEAMAMGVPVVVSRAGGLAELVEDGVTGLAVPPGDPTLLADAIAAMLGDPVTRQRLGDAGRRAAQDRYGPLPYREKLHAILSSVGRST